MGEAIAYRGYRYELRPTAEQAQTLREWIGVTRFIYNLCLEQRRDWWRQFERNEGRDLNWIAQSREVTDLRALYPWIAAPPRNALDHAVQDLEAAFRAFFKGKAKYPSPRAKGMHDTIRLKSEGVAIRRLNRKWSAVKLPKTGWMKFRDTRQMAGEQRTLTITNRAGRWFIVFSRKLEVVPNEGPSACVGIDRGVAQTLTLSTGEVFNSPSFGAQTKRLMRAQRRLARARKGSARRGRRKALLAGLRAKSARVRADWCQRTSTEIARRYDLVAVEDLKIIKMTASARGTAQRPGRGVRQKAGLNRSILEQCWGKFATFLDYKLTERGGMLISVPAAYTSQTCACCGVVDARSRKSQAVFECVHCGHVDNADVNAAKEILRRSTVLMGVEGSHWRPDEAPAWGNPNRLAGDADHHPPREGIERATLQHQGGEHG